MIFFIIIKEKSTNNKLAHIMFMTQYHYNYSKSYRLPVNFSELTLHLCEKKEKT